MFRNFFIVILLMFIAACGSSPKTHFYMLNAENNSDLQTDLKNEYLALGIWTVKLPEQLDRSEIVTRTGQYNIQLADFHHWAGDLSNNMTGLIAAELGQLLQSDRIVISPWPAYRKNLYQIEIRVDRFDGELGGTVALTGTWSLLNSKGDQELTQELFAFTAQTKTNSYTEMVAVLSELTVKLAAQIAETIAAQK